MLQLEAVECGAASLAMVLAYHKTFVPLEELRALCGVNRDGTKATNLLKAARTFGLSARGFKKEPERLLELPLPLIIHWNFNHFVVLEGYHQGRWYINDPAGGRLQIEDEAFDMQFTGIALAFEPTGEYEPQGQPASATRLLAGALSDSRSGLAYVLAASVALVVPGIAIAGFSRVFVDNILLAGRDNWLIPLILGMGVAMLLRGALTALQQKYLLRLEAKLAVSMSASFLWHLANLPMTFFTQRHVGDLSDRMSANDRVANLLSGQLATNVLNLVSVVFYAVAIALFDVVIALVAIVLASMNAVGLALVDRRREDASRDFQMAGGKVMAATVSAIRTAETLKASGLEHDAFTRWSGYQARMLVSQQKLGLTGVWLVALPILLAGLTTTAILGLGGLRVMEGSLSVGSIVAIQSLMMSFTAPIGSLVNLGSQFQAIKGELVRLMDVRAHALIPSRASADDDSWQGPAVLSGRVSVKDVSFGYGPLDPPLIEGMSLTLQPGTRIALVGGSGSGKSTMGRIIAGLQPPWSGSIELDDLPLASLPPQVFAGSVAYVDQDVFLFAGTVRENLTLWNDAIPESTLTRALKDAMIFDEIVGREGQFESEVQEGGLNFSGGQRQRLEIARALVNDPTLLILDEATSALDVTTEKMIDDNLRRRGCACLIIAHRLSTIRDCDEILVLQRGKIVERGTHEELLADGTVYTRLLGADA